MSTLQIRTIGIRQNSSVSKSKSVRENKRFMRPTAYNQPPACCCGLERLWSVCIVYESLLIIQLLVRGLP